MSFAIGIQNIKTSMNLGTLFRSAVNFGASMVFTIGKRYKGMSSDTVKAQNHIPVCHYDTFDDFKKHIPLDYIPIGVELTDKSFDLTTFVHPKNCLYLLGAEDHGLTKEALNFCPYFVQIPSNYCLNVAVAGSVVMYDRLAKDKNDNRSKGNV